MPRAESQEPVAVPGIALDEAGESPRGIALPPPVVGAGPHTRAGQVSLAVADQVIYSGLGFGATVLLGRFAGQEALGIFDRASPSWY